MRDANLIGPWVRRFLLEHVITDRNFARNTQVSYRDAMVLLLPYMRNVRHKGIDRLTVDDLSPSVVRSFLEHLEKERGCCGTTRNLRLATIHSLAKFIAMHCPEVSGKRAAFLSSAGPTSTMPAIVDNVEASDERTEATS